MLAVFIDECGAGFAPYIDGTTKILLPMLEYVANNDIRASVAEALPGLVKSAKEAGMEAAQLQTMGKTYVNAIFAAAKKETEAEVMQNQLIAIKDVIEEAGSAFFNQEECNVLSEATVKMVDKSLERIEESKKLAKEAEDDDDNEDFDQDDLAVYKDEIKTEYELQINAAEVMGVLMKTHPTFVAPLIT